MTPDYAIPLKRAWEATDRVICECDGCLKAKQEIHAALLEMVDDHHAPNCGCIRTLEEDFLTPGRRVVWEACDECRTERRRLRAAVGVEEGKEP